MAEIPTSITGLERVVAFPTRFWPWVQENAAERWLILAIFGCLALQFYQLFSLEVNWDEFLYLSRIYDYQSQTLNRALQTFHIYFFGWLPLIGPHEVRQVEFGRCVMLVLEAGTAWFIYKTARSFTSRTASLVATLAFVSAGFTMIHGASFRADPIAAFFIMGSLAILARAKLTAAHFSSAAVLMAVAAMITVKVGFYAPALVTLGFWQASRSDKPYRTLVCFILTGVGALAVFTTLYVWHEARLPAADMGGSRTMMSSAAKTTILSLDLFPTWNDVLIGMTKALVPTILLGVGTCLALFSIFQRRGALAVPLTMIGLAAPLLSFLFYRNAYPYFFSFIFPPAMVLAAYAVDEFRLNNRYLIAVAAVMAVSAIATVFSVSDRDQDTQREIIDTVHKMFPEPVNFIDRNHMIASFPKRGIFMSRWGLQEYRQAGEPIFDGILREETVPLLIINSPTLEDAIGLSVSTPLKERLFEADRKTLRSNYIEHWGKIWVAGKAFSVEAAPKKFNIAIPGQYVLEAVAPVIIDGKLYVPKQILYLGRGDHSAAAIADQNIVLRWSNVAYRPDFKPMQRPVYRGF